MMLHLGRVDITTRRLRQGDYDNRRIYSSRGAIMFFCQPSSACGSRMGEGVSMTSLVPVMLTVLLCQVSRQFTSAGFMTRMREAKIMSTMLTTVGGAV